MSIFKHRGQILSDRLGLIGAYLIENGENGKPFDVFLVEKGISKEDFVDGLPEKYKNPPTQKREDVIEYGQALNNEFYDAYLSQMGRLGLSADGEKESKIMSCSGGCGCGGGKTDSLNGRYGQGVVHEGDRYFASGDTYSASGGGCGFPPIPPLRSRKRAPEHWAKYDEAKAKWDACRSEKKENKGKEKKKGMHILNQNDPLFVIARNAFRFLVSINYKHTATRLDQIHQKDTELWNLVAVKWYNIGGDESKLLDSISAGRNKRTPLEILKGKKHSADGVEYYHARYMDNADGSKKGVDYTFHPTAETYSIFGADDAAVASAIASASAILASLKPIIEKFNNKNGIPNAAEDNLTSDSGTQTPETDQTNERVGDAISHGAVVDENGQKIANSPPPIGFFEAHKIPIIIGGSIVFVMAIGLIIASAGHASKANAS